MTLPRYPNVHEKHVQEVVFSPEQAVARYLASRDLVLPQAVVLTYRRRVTEELEDDRLGALEDAQSEKACDFLQTWHVWGQR